MHLTQIATWVSAGPEEKQFYGGMANFMMAINCMGDTIIKFNGIVISAFIYTHDYSCL